MGIFLSAILAFTSAIGQLIVRSMVTFWATTGPVGCSVFCHFLTPLFVAEYHSPSRMLTACYIHVSVRTRYTIPCLIVPAAQVLGEPRRRNTEPEQTRYRAAFFRRRRVATPPGTTLEQLAATLAFLTSVGAAVVASGTVDAPLPRPALPRHIAPPRRWRNDRPVHAAGSTQLQ